MRKKPHLTYLIKLLEDEVPCQKGASLGYMAFQIQYTYCLYHRIPMNKEDFEAIIVAIDKDYPRDVIDKEGEEYYPKAD